MAELANDLNTANAKAPIFDLVRAGNTAIDQGKFFAGDRDAILKVLVAFDAVFDFIKNNDDEPTRRALEWAEQAGRVADVAPELLARQALSDEAVEALVAERKLAGQEASQTSRTRRPDPKRIAWKRGVILEERLRAKDGVRWKRKVIPDPLKQENSLEASLS